MNSIIANSLDAILSESDNFQQLIDEEKWEELDRSLSIRQSKLEKLFAAPVDEAEKPKVLKSIQKIIQQDKQFAKQVQQAKTKSSQEVLEIKSRSNAIKAYSIIHEDHE